MIYSIDFETRSHANLPDVGLDIYANDDTTEVLCIAWGNKPENVSVGVPQPSKNWQDTKGNILLHVLLDHVANGGKIAAWNAMFEYAIWNCVCVPKYGWPPLKLEQCIDSMAIAAANNVPQSLDDAGDFLATDYKKDGIGKKLIQKLCKPTIRGDFNNDAELLKPCLVTPRTVKPVVQQPPPIMCGKKKRQLLAHDSNLVPFPYNAIQLQIGSPSVETLSEDGWTISRQIFTCAVITSSAVLNPTIYNLLVPNEQYTCIGESQALASQGGLGTKPVYKHTLKIRAANSGMVTDLIRTLSLTSSVAALTFLMFCDGSTDIQFSLKSKERLSSFRQPQFGSLLTSTPAIGTPS